MLVDFPKFTAILADTLKNKKITNEEAQVLRNYVATLTRPKCPKKLALSLAHHVNLKLGNIVDIKGLN